MKKTTIISALLLAPVLCAQEPQSPIIHTETGPTGVISETRIFVNGKELTPQEVDEFKKQGAAAFLKNKVKPVQAPTTPAADAEVVRPDVVPVIRPEPVKVVRPDVVPVIRPEPVKVVRPDVVPVIRPEPVKVVRPDVVPVIRPEPVKVVRPDVVPVIRPEPVKVVRPEPTKPACSCKPVCNCKPTPGKPSCCAPAPAPTPAPAVDTKPAEPDTPVLPTPALDAKPATPPAPACAASHRCEAKVIINGKEIAVPANEQTVKISIGADGKPVVTPVP